MMKITALNEISSSDIDDEFSNILTKEAQEQVALNEYNRALGLLINNQKEEALDVFEDLLNTQLLDEVKKPQVQDGRSRPMLSLKYSCFKNVASIHAELKNYCDALYNYWEAVNLDDSDVMLWYRIGIVAIEISNLEQACLAFKQGLQRNDNHWPCLDNIITVLYAIPDYMNCLLYISIALERDPSYVKGLAFREQILKSIPSLEECYKSYNSNWIIDPPFNTKYDQTVGTILINEANQLRKKWIKAFETQTKRPVLNLALKRSLVHCSWSELGKSLLDMHRYIIDNRLNFVSHITLNVSNWSNDFLCNKSELDVSKEIAENVPDSKKGFDNFTEYDLDVLPINKTDESCIKPIHNIEDLFEIQIHKYDISELDINNDNVCETKVEKDNLLSIKSYDDKYLNKNINIYTVNDEVAKFENEKDKGQKVKKRRRSSLCFLTQWEWSSSNTKRTSRARTSGRKDYERDGIILEETLKRIFPPTLLPDNTRFTRETSKNNDDSMDTMDINYTVTSKENHIDDAKSTESSKPASPVNECQLAYFGTNQEVVDVSHFIKKYTVTNNIMTAIRKFLEFLCTKWTYEWPDELSELYIQLYLLMRQHIPHPSPFIQNREDSMHLLDAKTTLLFCELYADKWLSTKSCVLPIININRLGIGISSEDLGCLIFYCSQDYSYNDKDDYFLARLLWLKANIFLYQGDIDISLKTLEQLLKYMERLQLITSPPIFKLINCKHNSIISVQTVENMLTSIQRGKKFCEIKYLYQNKKYDEISCILKDTFNFAKQSSKFILCKEIPIDRVEHLQILLDSLWQLQQHEECYVWAEACLNESWHNYIYFVNICTNEEERNKWTQSVLYSLEKLDACVAEVSTFIVKYLSDTRRSRLVQNLVHIVCHQLDVLDNTTLIPIDSILPWTLLHSILQFEEDKQRAKTVSTQKFKSISSIHSESDEDDEDCPASITILLKAHEFLGRHGWCCINDGKLLIFIMKSIIPKLHCPLYYPIKQKLKESIEQVIYCLYGHPAKFSTGMRSRLKYLEEHVKCHKDLTWESCQLLFDFYKPERMPSFESKRVDSINTDTVSLFKRICALIPFYSDATQIAEEMHEYLHGNREKPPIVKKPLEDQISYIYYLIADHYFKAATHQSWSNAAKYYIFDLCLHPNELNSWAGLAMSTGTLMETWLNNFQPNINEDKYLKKAKLAERSYQHAVDLAPSHLNIWTEFGNFLYTVHSFCSRLLKQESDSLNMERFRILENRKEEMLDKAKNCFASANHIYATCQGIDESQDERWLYQYMLAKIAEKKNEDPPVFLKHYSKASELLFENNAHYPRKISHKNPQNLAIEALEVYYRIHASILKYLEQHEGKPIKRSLAVILEQTLKNCMQSPFMTYDSTLRDKSKEYIASEGSLSANQEICKTKENATYTPESRQAVLVKSVIDNRKVDCRKRYSNDAILMNDAKKIKLSSVSHLQLMQDVVALIDELITKVCDKVSCKQSNFKWKDSKPNFEPNNSYLNTNAEMVDRNSHIMDNLWKEKIVFLQAKDKLTSIQDGIRKSEGHWMQNEDIQMENLHKLEKSEERKRICKLDGVPSRRASQESTTTTQTTTTETNNSTSSSSDESSSSDDSSDSSSSSDSDSESGQSEIEKKKTINLYEDAYLTEEETNKLIQYCLAGLEQCVLRFPEHYKSIYRLAYFFFNNKTAKNILKCKQLLLETYECQFHSNQTIQGLFSERKNTNFFNGIWRIPIQEIDRPGSFASHMSRCVLLLMQVLKEIGDSRILTELCIQLRKTPDTEKKYLRDTEREQLSHQALTLCLQCLRNKIKTANVLKLSTDTYQNSIDEQIQVLLDIYNTYQHIKNIQEYENLEIPKLQKLLEDAYTASVVNPNVQGNIFELAKEYCRQKIREKKFGCASIDSNVSMKSINTNPFPTNINMDLSSSNIPLTTLSRKSQKIVSGRPRGRPPGIHKFSQVTNNDSVLNQNRYSMQHSSASNTYTVNTNNRSSNPYCLNPFFESNVLAAILGSGYNSNMIDSAVGYFNQVTAYPNALQQYQNTLNTISNINVSNTKKSSDSLSNIEATHNMTMTSSNLSFAKDKPDISITPVTGYVPQNKSKSVKTVSTSNLHSDHAAMTSQFSKSVKILSTPQYSLPKPSVQQQRLPQTPLEVQVPFTSISSPLKDSKSTHYTAIPQTTKTIITSMNETSCAAQSGISLQHKLLSKKQDQRPRHLTTTANSMKKQKYNKTDIHSNYVNLLNNLSNPYVSSNLNAIPVSTTPSLSGKSTKLLSSEQKSIINVKTPDIKVSASNLQSDSNVNTLSVLSQLQQHSHLEIIPQSSLARKNIDLIHVPKKSMGIQNLRETVNLSNTSSLSVYELPRRKLSTNFSSTAQGKKQDKVEKNTVEIITLDD